MRDNHRRRIRTLLVATASVSALALGACSSSETEGDLSEGMGNATPIPAASGQQNQAELPGQIIPLPDHITSAAVVGDRVLLKSDKKIFAGNLQNPAEQTADLSAKCGDLSASGMVGIIPCDDGIHVLNKQGGSTAVVGEGVAYSSAVGLENGRIIGHRADNSDIEVFGDDGEHAAEFAAARHGSDLIAVPNPDGGEISRLMEINRNETSVHDIRLDDNRLGSSLRAGIGVAKGVAAPDGTVFATDAKGNQLLVYTLTDVIRLHEAAPVPEAPWAIAFDTSRNIVWVTSTKEGKLTGWEVSSGTPIKVAELNTVADPQSMVALADGRLAVYSASGAGMQVLTADDVKKAIEDGAGSADEQRKMMDVREPANNLPAGDNASDNAGNGAGDSAGDNSGEGK